MPRQPIRPRVSTVPRPAASPVDTFVAPGPSTAEQLAGALARAAGTVEAVHLQSEARRREQDKEKALLAFQQYKDEASAWSEVIKLDPELESESPFFRHVMETQFGEAAAARIGDVIADDMVNGALSVMDSDFDAVTGALVDEHAVGLSEESEAYRLGFAKRLEAELMQRRGEWRQSQRNLRLQAGNESFTQAVEQVLWDDPENLSAHVNALIIRAINGNMDPARVNLLVVNAIRNVAKEQLDPTLFDILDELPTPGGTVGQIPSINALRNKFITEINNEITRRNNIEWTQRQRNQQVALEDTMGELYTRMSDDVFADTTDLERKLAEKGLAAHIASFKQAKNVFQNGTVAEDNPVTRRVLAGRIMDRRNPLTVLELTQMYSGMQLGQGDYDYLVPRVQARDAAIAKDSPNKDQYTHYAGVAADLAELRVPGIFGSDSAPIDEILSQNAQASMFLWIAENMDSLDAMAEPERRQILDAKAREFAGIERARGLRIEDIDEISEIGFSPLQLTATMRASAYRTAEIVPAGEVEPAMNAVNAYLLQEDIMGEQLTVVLQSLGSYPEVAAWVDNKITEIQTTVDNEIFTEMEAADKALLELYFMLLGQADYHRTVELVGGS